MNLFVFEKSMLGKQWKITLQVAEMVIKKSKSTTYRYLTMLVATGYVEVSGNTNNAMLLSSCELERVSILYPYMRK